MPQLKMVSSSCMHRVALAGGTRESGYSRLKWKRTPKHCKPAELDIFLSGRPIGHIPRRVGLSRLPISPALCLKIVLPRFRSSCILWWKSSRRLYGHRTFFASYGLVIDDHGFGSRPSFRRSAKREREREKAGVFPIEVDTISDSWWFTLKALKEEKGSGCVKPMSVGMGGDSAVDFAWELALDIWGGYTLIK